MKDQISKMSNKMSDEQKRNDLDWRKKDKIRLEGNKATANAMFRDVVFPYLQSKKAFGEVYNCEAEGRTTAAETMDQEWGIDWVAERDGHIIGIAARASFFEGFTIRKKSRGYNSEFYKMEKNLKDKSNPIDPNKTYAFQIQTMIGPDNKPVPDKLHIIKVQYLIDFISKHPDEVIHKINSQDGNPYAYVSCESLIAKGYRPTTIDIPWV